MKAFVVALFLGTSFSVMALEKGECRKIVKEACGQHKGDRQAFKACLVENKEKFPEECRERAKKWRKHKKEKKDQRQETSES